MGTEKDRGISNTLKIAALWAFENGCADPTQGNGSTNAADALRRWYDARWSPTRPKDSRVDRLGNPR